MSSVSVALRDIVSAVKAEGNYREWGHAPEFLKDIERDRGSINDARNLQVIQARHALLQLLQVAWGGFERTQRALRMSSNLGVVQRSAASRFLTIAWRSLPVLLDPVACREMERALAAIRLDAVAMSELNDAQRALLEGELGVNFWVMPFEEMSIQSLMTESLWGTLGFRLDVSVVSQVLGSTERALSEILKRAGDVGLVAPLSQNSQALAAHFRLPSSEGLEWLLGAHHAIGVEKIRSEIQGLESYLPGEWLLFLAECEQSLGFSTGSLVGVFGSGHVMGETSLHPSIPESTHEWLHGEHGLIQDKRLEDLLRFYPNPEGFLQTLFGASIREVGSTDLAESSFEFLGQDWINLLALARSSRPLRALVVGEGSCGKTSLAQVVAKVAQKKLFKTTAQPGKTGWFQMCLQGAQKSVMWEGPSLLLVDAADAALAGKPQAQEEDLPTFLLSSESKENLKASEIWVLKTLKDVDPSAIRAFDLVVRLGSMPLVHRVALAKEQFQDETLATQVAQSCATAGEILALAEWKKATGLSDWTSLSSRLSSVQQAMVSTKEAAGELPVVVYPPQPGNQGFADVVGQDNIVRQARRAIAGLRDPAKFKKLGGKMPKGILLKGGPGMGKTHLARAMAGEAGVPLLLADSAAMARSPELIAAVFAEARRQAPCLLFLDELDAVGTAAKGAMGASPDPTRQAILNRLLTELSGFTELEGVLVVGATHRSELLDAALIRSGRLGLHLHLEEPTRKAREDIWRHYAQKVACADVINWERLGRISAGMSPADIAQAVDQAVLNAFGDDCDRVGYKHFVEAVDQVLWNGDELELPMIEEEQRRTAVHEAGHAMLAWHAQQDIERVSIRPRGVALGFVRTLQEEGRYGMAPENIVGQLAMVFGGLAAETVVFGNHTTGVSSDLAAARRLARLAVRVAGMEVTLPAGVPGLMEPEMSEQLLRTCERLEQKMLSTLRESAVSWLTDHRQVLEDFADKLKEQREMDGEEVQAWLNERLRPEENGEAASGVFGVVAAAEKWPMSMGSLAARDRHLASDSPGD